MRNQFLDRKISLIFVLLLGLSVLGCQNLVTTPTPMVVLTAQVGTITSGAAGSAIFAATTTDVTDGTTGSVAWYSDATGTTIASAPSGLSAAVSAVSGNAATVTVMASASVAAGNYYFMLSEAAAVSAVATLTVESATSTSTANVVVGSQVGAISAGTAGSATFAVTTSSVADNTVGNLVWYSDASGTTTAAAAPADVTASVSAVSANAASVTLAATTAVAAGTYYFRLVEGTESSAVASLVVWAAGTAPTVYVGTQWGTPLSVNLVAETTHTVTFDVTTARVADGTAGIFSWYADAAGITPASAPTGISATVTNVSSNASVITMSSSALTVAGTYYFRLSEGIPISNLKTLVVNPRNVNVGGQTGSISSGTAGSATFTATTNFLSTFTSRSLIWCDTNGTPLSSDPTGLSAALTVLAGNQVKITINATTGASVGNYYFKVVLDSVTSAIRYVIVN